MVGRPVLNAAADPRRTGHLDISDKEFAISQQWGGGNS